MFSYIIQFLRFIFSFLVFSVLLQVKAQTIEPVIRLGFDGSTIVEEENEELATIVGNIAHIENRFGIPCSAIQLNGNEKVILESGELIKFEKGFRISVWANCSDVNKWFTLFAKATGADENDKNPNFRLQITPKVFSVANEVAFKHNTNLSPNTWYNFVFIFDGKNNIRFYIDGAEVANTSLPRPLQFNKSDLILGFDEPGRSEFFTGQLDDFRIYDKPITISQVKAIYNDKVDATLMGCKKNATPVIYEQPLADYPVVIDKDSIRYQKTIVVSDDDLSISFYDHQKEDRDVISVNINGEWVAKDYKLKNKSLIKPAMTIKYKLKKGDNFLVCKALNHGTLGLNTTAMEIRCGQLKTSQILYSRIGYAGAIRIVVK